MLFNKQDKILLKIIALILIILFVKKQISPQHYIKEEIDSIVENEDTDNINAPKDLINDIKEIYTLSEINGFPKPEYQFRSNKPVKVKGKNYYNIVFMSYKYSKDGKSGELKAFSVLLEIDGNFPNYGIISYRVLTNSFKE